MLRLTLRNLLARKVRLLMSTLAILLGVAFLAGVMTFSHGLQRTFDTIVVGSTSDGTVRSIHANTLGPSLSGRTAELTPADVEELAALPEVGAAYGRIDGVGMTLVGRDGRVVGSTGAPTLAFNYTEAASVLGTPIVRLMAGRWPTAPGEITLDDSSAQRGQYQVGDEVTVNAPQGELVQQFRLVGIGNFNGGGTAGATLILFSTEGAQQTFLNGADKFTSILLTAAPGVSPTDMVAAVQPLLPRGFEAVDGATLVAESQDAMGEFLSVISTFLLVFAIIAVVVGAFIIVNTFSILIAQRTRELALLRALGAGREQVTRSVLLEAFVMSLTAATGGIAVGWALARGLAAVFSVIGLDIDRATLTLTPTTVWISYAVGVTVTMLAAYVPARRAANIPPIAAMREDSATRPASLERRTVLGTMALILGLVAAFLGLIDAPGDNSVWVGAGAFAMLLSVALISPVLGKPVLLACRAIFARCFGTTGRLAGDNSLRDPRRTGATASALMIGLALVSTIGVLAASLNKSVEDLVDKSFRADFMIQGTNFQPFPVSIAEMVKDLPGVGEVSQQQFAVARVDGAQQFLTGVDPVFDRMYRLDMAAGQQEMSGNQAIVSQAIAENRNWTVGSTIHLFFQGTRRIPVTVVGIFTDEGVTSSITVPSSLLTEAGVQPLDSRVSINTAEGMIPPQIKASLQQAVYDVPIVTVLDKQAAGDAIRGQVAQLLNLIYGLLGLAIVIAVIGIVNTLGLSVMERTREIGLLRALGLSRPRLRQMITLESVAIAILGAVLGLILGLVFGSMLQWTLRDQLTSLGLPVNQLLWFLAIAVVVGVVAAVLPAIRAAKLNVLDAISTE